LNAKRIEEQRCDLIKLIEILCYKPASSNEELLLSVLGDKCPIPPQLRKELIKIHFKLRDLEKERLAISGNIKDDIKQLCSWLEVPLPKILLSSSLSLDHIEGLKKQLNSLKQEQITKIDLIFDRKISVAKEYCQALSQLNLLQGINSIDKLFAIDKLDGIIKNLKPKYESSSLIRSLIEERHDLIQKMKAFEVSASDPARLFQPSFRLLQEEKFRKSALPTLLKLEARLKKEMGNWDGKFPYNGVEDFESALEEEIANRYVNETVFGFSTSITSSISSNSSSSTVPRASTPQKINTSGNSQKSTASTSQSKQKAGRVIK
jgi:hypothetical protein